MKKLSKNFLKNFKKNDIVIYAIALMLVTAGYFNYTTNIENETLDTYSENVAETEENINTDDSDIGEARLVSNNETETVEETESEETELAENDEINETEEIEYEENTDNESDETTDTSEDESTQQSESEEIDTSDYFASSKLERDTNYASMISTYTQIVESDDVSETQKSIAMTEITEINDLQNAISICENLISTKGFSNSLILINDESINVVVEIDGGLTTEGVAQIQNIISRELGAEIDNIHIMENE